MIIECDNCKIQFNKGPASIKNTRHNFCSIKCQGEFIRLDLIGQKFEEIEVLEFDSIKKYKTSTRSMFKCRCSCGKIMVVSGSSLKSDLSTKCRKCANRRKYVGEISGRYFSSIKKRARESNIFFNITQQDIFNKFLEQNRKCIYSGLELTWQDSIYDDKGIASVDRIDSSIGYIINNIHIVHKHINSMKLNHTEKYFLNLCEKIAFFDGRVTSVVNYKQAKKPGQWKGYGEISKENWITIKNNAENLKNKRGLDFNITIEYIWDLYLQQGAVCILSGLPIIFEPSSNRLSEKTASLDRIDSSVGYTKGNVQWLHKDINKMKLNHNQDYFIDLCRKVVENHGIN